VNFDLLGRITCESTTTNSQLSEDEVLKYYTSILEWGICHELQVKNNPHFRSSGSLQESSHLWVYGAILQLQLHPGMYGLLLGLEFVGNLRIPVFLDLHTGDSSGVQDPRKRVPTSGSMELFFNFNFILECMDCCLDLNSLETSEFLFSWTFIRGIPVELHTSVHIRRYLRKAHSFRYYPELIPK